MTFDESLAEIEKESAAPGFGSLLWLFKWMGIDECAYQLLRWIPDVAFSLLSDPVTTENVLSDYRSRIMEEVRNE